jgi:ATP-dependent RNA helicase SUPV3L1/SUV3
MAGRAGRRSSKFGQGLVTCLNASDTARLQQALDAPLDSMSTNTAGLFVEFEQLEAFAGAQLESTFDGILTRCVLVSIMFPSLQAFKCVLPGVSRFCPTRPLKIADNSHI